MKEFFQDTAYMFRSVFRKKRVFMLVLLACILWGCNSRLPAPPSDPGTGSTEFPGPASATAAVSTDVIVTKAVSTSTPDSTSTPQQDQSFSDSLTPGFYIVYSETTYDENGESNEKIIASTIDGNEKITLYTGDLYWASISPTDYQVAFVQGGDAFGPPSEIFILDLDNKSTTKVPGSEQCITPAWSPDGTMLAFNCYGEGDTVYISTLDGQQRYPILPHPPILQSGGPAWSPDGNWLAYFAGQFRSGIAPEYNGIYITTVESILENEIPSHKNTRGPIYQTSRYSWTADGEHLAYLSQPNEISLYNIRAWSSQVLFTIEEDIKDFACSPEGDWIALQTSSGIYVTHLYENGELSVVKTFQRPSWYFYLNFWMIVE